MIKAKEAYELTLKQKIQEIDLIESEIVESASNGQFGTIIEFKISDESMNILTDSGYRFSVFTKEHKTYTQIFWISPEIINAPMV